MVLLLYILASSFDMLNHTSTGNKCHKTMKLHDNIIKLIFNYQFSNFFTQLNKIKTIFVP